MHTLATLFGTFLVTASRVGGGGHGGGGHSFGRGGGGGHGGSHISGVRHVWTGRPHGGGNGDGDLTSALILLGVLLLLMATFHVVARYNERREARRLARELPRERARLLRARTVIANRA